MANRKIPKEQINKSHFMKVLKEAGVSIRDLDDPKGVKKIHRNEKTIRRCLNSGEMPREVLENIAEYIGVHPYYLSGKYAECNNEYICEFYKRLGYQSVSGTQSTIDYIQYFDDTLNLFDISVDQFKRLHPIDRVILRQKLITSVLRVLSSYFEKDCMNRNIKEQLQYYESQENDFDPDSYFAKLEGIKFEETSIGTDSE